MYTYIYIYIYIHTHITQQTGHRGDRLRRRGHRGRRHSGLPGPREKPPMRDPLIRQHGYYGHYVYYQ